MAIISLAINDPKIVIPAEAGIFLQTPTILEEIPASAGMTTIGIKSRASNVRILKRYNLRRIAFREHMVAGLATIEKNQSLLHAVYGHQHPLTTRLNQQSTGIPIPAASYR